MSREYKVLEPFTREGCESVTARYACKIVYCNNSLPDTPIPFATIYGDNATIAKQRAERIAELLSGQVI